MRDIYTNIHRILDTINRHQEDFRSCQEERIRHRKWLAKHESLAQNESTTAQNLRTPFLYRSCVKSGRLCPGCGQEFLLIRVGDLDVDLCRTCGGFWFDAGDIRALAKPGAKVAPGDLLDKPSPYKCPFCALRLEYRRQSCKPPLRVHACPAGHGFYIEKGEYMLALRIRKRGKP